MCWPGRRLKRLQAMHLKKTSCRKFKSRNPEECISATRCKRISNSIIWSEERTAPRAFDGGMLGLRTMSV